jgi:hypothetical protein
MCKQGGKGDGRTVFFCAGEGKRRGWSTPPPPPQVGDGPELVFVNVYGAQESIPKNRLRKAMEPWRAGIRQIGLLYRPAGLEIDSWAP